MRRDHARHLPQAKTFRRDGGHPPAGQRSHGAAAHRDYARTRDYPAFAKATADKRAGGEALRSGGKQVRGMSVEEGRW